MKQYLERLGLEIREERPATAQELSKCIEIIMEMYVNMLDDIVLQPAAYGCAIGGLSLALDVNLRTAAIVFEEWLRLRGQRLAENNTFVIVG